MFQRTPFSVLDVKLCKYINETEGIISFLLAVTTQVDLKEAKSHIKATDVTLGFFDKNRVPSSDGQLGEYVDLTVRNLGLNDLDYNGASNVFNRQTLASMGTASTLSAQLRTQLENVHDSYQRQLQPPQPTV